MPRRRISGSLLFAVLFTAFVIIVWYFMSWHINVPVQRIGKTSSRERYLPRRTILPLCTTPRHHVAYVKVQKTGGTTFSGQVLEPYGDKHQLSFVHGYYPIRIRINFPYHLRQSDILPPVKSHYDFFTREVRYNVKFFQQLMPSDTVYIFSFRKPVERFVSAFYFLEAHKKMFDLFNITNHKLMMELFLSDPENLLRLLFDSWVSDKRTAHIIPEIRTVLLSPSAECFSMGLDNANSMDDIHDVVGQIISEFDTFVLAEYFDESMVLVKRTMCWELDDVLYTKINLKRTPKEGELTADALPDSLRSKILDYNRADAVFYHHANETFWKKISKERDFYEELSRYRNMVKTFSIYCADPKGPSPYKKECARVNKIHPFRDIFLRQRAYVIGKIKREVNEKLKQMTKH